MTATTKKQEEVKEQKIYFRPMSNNVLLLAEIVKEKVMGDKVIELQPDSWLLKSESLVLAVGNDCRNIKPGDKVLLNTARTPHSVPLFGVETLHFNELEILGVLEEGEESFNMAEFIPIYIEVEKQKKEALLDKMRNPKTVVN